MDRLVKRNIHRSSKLAALYIVVIGIACIIIFPMFFLVSFSFMSDYETFSEWPKPLIPSFNVDFIHLGGNDRFNTTYSVNYDFDHRTLEPGASLTGTLREEITSPEADYNVSIYFKALDAYHPHETFGPSARDYIAAENITVSVVDFGGPSNIILGIGLTFAAGVGIVVIVIIYGWLKEKLTKRRY